MQAMLCRALNGHAWAVSGPIIVVAGNGRRVTLECARCESTRVDVWAPRGGAVLKRSYDRGEEYQAFIKAHDWADAREAFLAEQPTKEAPTNGEDRHAQLRLVQGAKRRRDKQHRRHQRRRAVG